MRDPSVSHDWLWRVSPAHGPLVPRGEFQVAVRLRLGAPCADPSTLCARCGATLGGTCSHALCCALPEATRGHYDVRNEVLSLAHLADPTAAAEAVGLIPSAPRRPFRAVWRRWTLELRAPPRPGRGGVEGAPGGSGAR